MDDSQSDDLAELTKCIANERLLLIRPCHDRIYLLKLIAECISKIKHTPSIAIKSNKKTQVNAIYVRFFALFCINLELIWRGYLVGGDIRTVLTTLSLICLISI